MTLWKLVGVVFVPILIIGALFFGLIMWRRSRAAAAAAPQKTVLKQMPTSPAKPAATAGLGETALKTVASDPKLLAAIGQGLSSFASWVTTPGDTGASDANEDWA